MKTTQGLGFLTSFVFVSCASVAHATVIDWSNTSGGDFNNGANWAGGTAPGASDTASFNTNAGSSYTASLSGNTDIRDVSVRNDRVVIDLNEHDLAIQSGISVNGNADSHLELKNGRVTWVRESTVKADIQVGSEFGTKTNLSLKKATMNVHSALIEDGGEMVITDGSHLELSNGITVEKGGSLRVSKGSERYSYINGRGPIKFDGEVVVDSGAWIDLGGTDQLSSINGHMTVQNGGDFHTGDLAIGGNLEMDGLDTHAEARDVTITGNLKVGHGTILSADSITVLSGGVLDQDEVGGLWMMSSAGVLVDGGKYLAAGSIEGHLANANHGTVSIGGNEKYIYTYAGGYEQDSTSTLELTLGAEDLLDDRGRYKIELVEGDAILEGILKIDLWETFKPKLNDEFGLIRAGAGIEGIFSHFILPDLQAGLAWEWGFDTNRIGDTLLNLKVVEGHSVPEPYTLALMTISLAGFAGARRFRKAA
ncbi:PEP-CTERM sorting domain-containing protein [Hahella sp. KA22]|uniref:PEP-CTERM sorting domain-containing protein n=1 Tax=Hahella sp. KA22 TaxID=1628392 RepID=UPI0013E3CD83|nr:PEP-CTERM sorting domain-containing protein [Hahella sp. KA22]